MHLVVPPFTLHLITPVCMTTLTLALLIRLSHVHLHKLLQDRLEHTTITSFLRITLMEFLIRITPLCQLQCFQRILLQQSLSQVAYPSVRDVETNFAM